MYWPERVGTFYCSLNLEFIFPKSSVFRDISFSCNQKIWTWFGALIMGPSASSTWFLLSRFPGCAPEHRVMALLLLCISKVSFGQRRSWGLHLAASPAAAASCHPFCSQPVSGNVGGPEVCPCKEGGFPVNGGGPRADVLIYATPEAALTHLGCDLKILKSACAIAYSHNVAQFKM